MSLAPVVYTGEALPREHRDRATSLAVCHQTHRGEKVRFRSTQQGNLMCQSTSEKCARLPGPVFSGQKAPRRDVWPCPMYGLTLLQRPALLLHIPAEKTPR